jgi:site-specific DNA-cytosine methylase
VKGLELFCGIGGFAAAVAGSPLRVVAALDQDPVALEIYRHNFPRHWARRVDLARITPLELASYGADFWWLSPPCQPYTERGNRLDLEDHRAASLLNLMQAMEGMTDTTLPRHLALENVAGFGDSRARQLLLELLARKGYGVQERLLCPSVLGVPSRRPRYYLAASLLPLAPWREPAPCQRPLADYLARKSDVDPDLFLAPETVRRYGPGLRVVDAGEPGSYTTCFTAAYGRSLMHSGSYLTAEEGVRRFSPEEVGRLLHFPEGYSFPSHLGLRRRWHYLGNSLSVAAIREVLTAFPELSTLD